MSGIIIRHSESSDIPAIKAIYEEKIPCTGTLGLPYSSLESWQKRLEKLPEGRYNLVAEQDDEIIGQISFWAYQRARKKHAGSFGMAVKEAHQGKGVGTKLLSAVTDLADNWLNLRRIEITVYTDNEAAIKLYKNHGFTIEGEAQDYAFREGKWANAYYLSRINKNSC